MKRQFLHRRSSVLGISASPWQVGGFIAVVIVLFLLLLVRLALPNLFVSIVSPFWESGSTIDTGVNSVLSSFSDKATLVKQNAALAQEVTILKNENSVLITRSQDLTVLLGGQSGSVSGDQSGTILAGVLVRPPVAAYDTLVVSAGTGAGVTAGAEAFANGGIPIGTVQSVTDRTSTIELFSNGGRSTDGWVGNSRTALTLTGEGAGTFSSILPKAAVVSVGDSVYVSGPGALPIGTVVKIDADPSSPTIVLHIQPLVNIFSLTWVQIEHA